VVLDRLPPPLQEKPTDARGPQRRLISRQPQESPELVYCERLERSRRPRVRVVMEVGGNGLRLFGEEPFREK
jgi:hypothetical protein